MSDADLILAIDQGTTSSRAIAFDGAGVAHAVAQREFPQIYPRDGWVEHDPEAIWSSVTEVCAEVAAALAQAGRRIACIGITNQRETTVVWDRATGVPIANAIVWQDRRTADACARLKSDGHEATFTARTGLLLDPYFSGTKIAWLLDHVDGARALAEEGRLAFGTVDTFLVWRLTGGRVHATDATNASRTLACDIHTGRWDAELLAALGVPEAVLPEVRDSAADYGHTTPDLFGEEIPITGVAGDQQAATVGQACFEPGMVKSTYGTGCFAVLNTGTQAVASDNRLLTTVAYRVGGETTYALEGSIFIAGAAVQWLRDGLKIIDSAPETEALARSLDSNEGCYLVPAFTGLGAPHWDPHARGAVFGLTRDTGVAHLARAALESVCYQTCDLLDAMSADRGAPVTSLRVDGGMVTNDWVLQTLADLTGAEVVRPEIIETTALGAAYLAGVGAGRYPSLADVAENWRQDRAFAPSLDTSDRDRLLAGWRDAVRRVRA